MKRERSEERPSLSSVQENHAVDVAFCPFHEIKSAWTLAIQLFKVDYLLVCSDDNRWQVL